ncbi:MAG TPA: twin-arginine translocase TatA/TatE family subunit [Gaiellaceae bacterium]|jgi:sec-independent protein translocase protein TatA
MPNVGPFELLLLGLLAVIIFGPAKLPEIGRSIGKSMREFKDSVSGVTDVKEAIGGVNEVRSAMTPTNLAGAFVPGVKDVQESVAAAKNLANPLAGETAAAEGANAEGAAAKPAAPAS